MRRRNFLFGLGALLTAPSALKSLPSSYKPIGHLHASDPGACDIDKVTVDGHEIRYVFELDDVEGWVRAYSVWERRSMEPVITRYTGEVRVTWKAK